MQAVRQFVRAITVLAIVFAVFTSIGHSEDRALRRCKIEDSPERQKAFNLGRIIEDSELCVIENFSTKWGMRLEDAVRSAKFRDDRAIANEIARSLKADYPPGAQARLVVTAIVSQGFVCKPVRGFALERRPLWKHFRVCEQTITMRISKDFQRYVRDKIFNEAERRKYAARLSKLQSFTLEISIKVIGLNRVVGYDVVAWLRLPPH